VDETATARRPASLEWAFWLWILIGVIAAPAVVGLIVLAAVWFLRSGRPGARVLLTAWSLLVPVLVAVVQVLRTGSPVFSLVPALAYGALVALAVALLWTRPASAYLRAR
jgi:hypothetical protein